MIPDTSNVEEDPIEILQNIAEKKCVDYTIVNNTQILMVLHGVWCTLSMTILWRDDVNELMTTCVIEMKVPSKRMNQFYELLNMINTACWDGTFIYMPELKQVCFKNKHVFPDDSVNEGLLERIINRSIQACNTYFQTLQLVAAGERPVVAYASSIGTTVGNA
jgi:hypothetical protein